MHQAEKRFRTTGLEQKSAHLLYKGADGKGLGLEAFCCVFLLGFVFTTFKNIETIQSGGCIKTGRGPSHSLLTLGLHDLLQSFLVSVLFWTSLATVHLE